MKKKLILLTMAGAILASGIQANAPVANTTDAVLEQVFNKAAEIAGIAATASKEVVLTKADEIAELASKLDDENLKTVVFEQASKIAGVVATADTDAVWDKASEIAELVAKAANVVEGEELFNELVAEATPAAIAETVAPEATSWLSGVRSGASGFVGKASSKFGKAKSAVSEGASAKYAHFMNSNFVTNTVPRTWAESTQCVKDHPVITAAVVVGTAATLYLGYKYISKKKKSGDDA